MYFLVCIVWCIFLVCYKNIVLCINCNFRGVVQFISDNGVLIGVQVMGGYCVVVIICDNQQIVLVLIYIYWFEKISGKIRFEGLFLNIIFIDFKVSKIVGRCVDVVLSINVQFILKFGMRNDCFDYLGIEGSI